MRTRMCQIEKQRLTEGATFRTLPPHLFWKQYIIVNIGRMLR